MSVGSAKDGMRWARFAAMALLLAGGWRSANGASAPTTSPAQRHSTSASDGIPLIHREAPRTSADRAAAAPAGGLGTARVVGALAVVVATIFVFRWLGQRIFGLQVTGGSGVIRILSRSTVSSKQQLMLIQVGRRLLLVANSGTQMNSLCEIHDSDEVAALMGQIQVQRGPSTKRSFLSAFRSAGTEFAHNDAPTDQSAAQQAIGTHEGEPSPLAGAREEIAGLLEKVRSISGSLKRA